VDDRLNKKKAQSRVVKDKDCAGATDPISMQPIPKKYATFIDGKCYDARKLAMWLNQRNALPHSNRQLSASEIARIKKMGNPKGVGPKLLPPGRQMDCNSRYYNVTFDGWDSEAIMHYIERGELRHNDVVCGYPLLHFAMYNGDIETTARFLEDGVDPNDTNGLYGRTFLHKAAAHTDEDVAIELATLLVAAGADKNARDNEGKTAAQVFTKKHGRRAGAMFRAMLA
jgi:hypothetical protein